jgi:hypothetical protein
MKRARTTSRHTFVLLLATLLAARGRAAAACKSTCTEELRACRSHCQGITDRRACRQQCADASTCTAPGARLRTAAYTVDMCREDAAGFSVHERLFVRRGNCDPVTLLELPLVGPVPAGRGLCPAMEHRGSGRARSS